MQKYRRQKSHSKQKQFGFINKNMNKNEQNNLNDNRISYQIARLLVNQKLIYIKAAKNYTQIQNLFKFYPFTNIKGFQFNKQSLLSQTNPQNSQSQSIQIHGQLIENQIGIHLVQNVPKNKKINQNKQNKQMNLFNGMAVSIFKNGSIFEGNYHDGKFCGRGLFISEQGDLYIGHFKHGIKQGYGVQYWFEAKETYQGNWQGDLPNDIGTYSTVNSVYQGNFLNGLKFGFGIQKYKHSGDYYVGEYMNGVSSGYGQYYWNDGSFYKGDFNMGIRHGFGVWQDDKEMYQGFYKFDQKQGFGIYLWKNKKVYQGKFKEDYRDGYGEMYMVNTDIKRQKVIFRGEWLKGEQNQSGIVKKQDINELYSFLDQTKQRIDDMPIKKQRLGHRNCVPEFDRHHSLKRERSK